jgi:YggT family protein
MGGQILAFLLQTVFGLFVYLALMRFYMQLFRAPFRNPVGQFVMALTDWAVMPLRKVLPSVRGYDIGSLVLAWLAQLALLVLLYALVHQVGAGNLPGMVLLQSVIELVRASLQLLIFVVIIQVILSWVSPRHPLMGVFDALSRPFCNIFRRFVPPIGNVDLSPLLVIVLVQVLLIMLDNLPRALLLGGG